MAAKKTRETSIRLGREANQKYKEMSIKDGCQATEVLERGIRRFVESLVGNPTAYRGKDRPIYKTPKGKAS